MHGSRLWREWFKRGTNPPLVPEFFLQVCAQSNQHLRNPTDQFFQQVNNRICGSSNAACSRDDWTTIWILKHGSLPILLTGAQFCPMIVDIDWNRCAVIRLSSNM